MRRQFFTRDHAELDPLEARLFERFVQRAFGKPQPTVAIKLMRLLEGVPGQMQDRRMKFLAKRAVRAITAGGGNPEPHELRIGAPGHPHRAASGSAEMPASGFLCQTTEVTYIYHNNGAGASTPSACAAEVVA